MAWSTRQLAELAGTTVKAVRHYHHLGLLDEPERAANGYKKYETAHLVRLIQIKRMTDLGLPLAQIAALGGADQHPDEAIRVLDAELADTVRRLQRIRAELAVIMKNRAPLDVPPAFGPVADEMSQRDRALITVLSRVLNEAGLGDVSQMASEPDPDADALDALPADADDATIDALARRLAVSFARAQDRFPWMAEPRLGSSMGTRSVEQAVGSAVAELFNPAQLTAIARAHALVQEQRRQDGGDAAAAPRSAG